MPMIEVSEADCDAVLDCNLKAGFLTAQACALRMIRARAAGSPIHIVSQMGHVRGPNRSSNARRNGRPKA
jgi:NAD(P)-dependent dehydrogenase (short-subunit alcohol dehydrogenase family)